MTLSPSQTLALSKIITESKVKAARAALGNGLTVTVDPFTLDCSGGKIVISAEESYTPTVDLPLLDMLVIALHKSGFQRDNILKMITEASSDALNSKMKVGESAKADIAFLKTEVAALRSSLSSGLPKKLRPGKAKVTAKWSNS